MADLLEDIVEYLKVNGLVQGDGIDAFRDVAPDLPDNAVIIYEYSGGATVLHEEAVHRSLQIVARSKSATQAKLKARAIFNVLSPLDQFKKLNVQRWCQLYPRQTPFRIKLDGNNRIYYGFNIGVTTYKD